MEAQPSSFHSLFRPGATFHIYSSSVLSLSRCRSTIDCSLFHGRPRKPFGKWHAKLGPVGSFLNDPYCFRPRDFNGRRREATDDFAFLSEEKTYRECLDYSYHIIHICIMVSQCTGVAFRLPAEMAAGWRRFPAATKMRDLYTVQCWSCIKHGVPQRQQTIGGRG